jgi:hypothetical protein
MNRLLNGATPGPIGRRRQAVTNVGLRPTFGEALPAPVVEAHLLDFDSDLYGTELGLVFIARLREERRFASKDELIAQIRRDVEQARDLLGAGLVDADPLRDAKRDPLRDAPSGVPPGDAKRDARRDEAR